MNEMYLLGLIKEAQGLGAEHFEDQASNQLPSDVAVEVAREQFEQFFDMTLVPTGAILILAHELREIMGSMVRRAAQRVVQDMQARRRRRA